VFLNLRPRLGRRNGKEVSSNFEGGVRERRRGVKIERGPTIKRGSCEEPGSGSPITVIGKSSQRSPSKKGRLTTKSS